jgi:hypothetical protein
MVSDTLAEAPLAFFCILQNELTVIILTKFYFKVSRNNWKICYTLHPISYANKS